jgi:hypothetical protein
MQTRTIIDRIEIEPQTGNIGVRMRKQVIDETRDDPETGDKVVVASEYHRAMLSPDTDPAAMMAAVDAHLGAIGFPPAKTEDRAVLDSALSQFAPLRAAKLAEAVTRAEAIAAAKDAPK